MVASLGCPNAESWQALFADALPADERERYERHLESCPTCQDRLDRADEDAGALLTLVRQVGDPTAAPADPTLNEFLDRLHEVKSAERAAPVEPAELYFLRPGDRPEVLGTLGVYEVLEVIGQGGMGIVLKAFDPALHRPVAIKVMAAALAGSATARRRFTREARAAAAVSHDHIVTVHGVDEADGVPYLVMQYVAGESLQARLDRTGPLEVADVVRIGLQTASALAAAHAQGLIHRDVKPANLLLENGLARVRITDFGLARMADDVRLTQNGTLAGTPEYMAPEQARGEPLDHRADLFSLGSVLYAMCTGLPPFRGSTAVAVLRQVSDQEPAPVRSLNADVPAWLEALISRLLAKDPADRFQSAAEVATLLEGYLAHLRQPATVQPPPPPSAPADDLCLPETRWWHGAVKRVARSPRLAALGCLAGLVLSVSLLAWAAAAPGQQAPAGKPPPAEFYQDFRCSRGAVPPMDLFGPDAEAVTRAEDGGLRVTLAANREHTDPVGVVLPARVEGDFEITAGYELIQADRPRGGPGVGFELYIMTATPAQDAIGFYRTVRHDEGDVYMGVRMTTPPGGQRQYQGKAIPTSSRSGRLRLTRKGREVTLSAADGAVDAFQVVERYDFGTEELQTVRLAGYTGYAKAFVDLRLVDLKILANSVSAGQAAASAGAKPSVGRSRGLRGWLAAVGIIGLAITASFLGLWLYARRLGQASAGRQTRPEAAPALLAFVCAGCGKKLRARAEMAGKKVKCPQCRESLLIPRVKSSDLPAASAAPEASLQGRLAGVPGRFSSLVWLPVIFILAALALATGYRFFTGHAASKLAQEAARAQPVRHVAFDFRAGIENFPSLSLEGGAAEAVATTDSQGLRITLPAGRGDTRPVELKLPYRLRGDFDIVLGYDLIAVGSPLPQYGAGVVIRVWFDATHGSTSSFSAVLSRCRKPSGECFGAHKVLKGPDGNNQYLNNVDEKATRSKGKLRLRRTGPNLEYLVAEEGQDFKRIQSVDVGTADVQSLQVDCHTMYAPIALDVRLIDLVLDADQVFDAMPSGDAPPSAAGPKAGRTGWLAPASLVGLVVILSLLGVRLYARRGAKAPACAGVGGRPLVSLQCPGCGKTLSASAKLAGKAVKCPQCRRAVVIPRTDPKNPATVPAAGPNRFEKRWVYCIPLVLLILLGAAAVGYIVWLQRPTPAALLNVRLGGEFVPGVEETGFSFQEDDPQGEPFRWTDGNARLAVPIDRRKPPRVLAMRIYVFRPPQVNRAPLKTVVNNCAVS